MRIDRDVPGSHGCDVYLDGEKLPRCYVADDDEGWAACEFLDAAGHRVMDRGDLLTICEIKRGVVTFAFDPPKLRGEAERWWRKRQEFIGELKEWRRAEKAAATG